MAKGDIFDSETRRTLAMFNTNHSPFRNDPNHGRFGTVVMVRFMKQTSGSIPKKYNFATGETRLAMIYPRNEIRISLDSKETEYFNDIDLKLGVDVEEVKDQPK